MKRKNPFCLGYGPYEGTCENRAGTAWGPYWCERCNKIRLETIDRQLREIIQSFEKTDEEVREMLIGKMEGKLHEDVRKKYVQVLPCQDAEHFRHTGHEEVSK